MWPLDQNLMVVAFLWQKLTWAQFYKDFTRKTNFFEVCSWFNFNNLELALGMALKLYKSKIYSKLSERWDISYQERFRREKIFIGETFCHLANILLLFPDFSSDIINKFHLSRECSKCPIYYLIKLQKIINRQLLFNALSN